MSRGARIGIVLAAGLVLGGCAGNAPVQPQVAAASAEVATTVSASAQPEDMLHDASRDCAIGKIGVGRVEDNGRTLVLDGRGEDDYEGATISEIQCVLHALGMSDAVWQRMMQTRALDGMQTADWDVFEATWTYHPKQGLDVIVTVA